VRALLAATLFGFVSLAPAKACDTALIILMDRSASMTDEEFRLQVQGTARAFGSPETVRRIVGSAGRGSIQARVASYDDTMEWHTPWTRIASQQDAERLAEVVAAIPRLSRGWTYTGEAVMRSVEEFNNLPEPCDRHVIDVSTDGVATDAFALSQARTKAEEAEIIINAITVAGEGTEDDVSSLQVPQSELSTWARENLITGIGSFALPATFQNYAQAMRTKLTMELAAASPTTTTIFSH